MRAALFYEPHAPLRIEEVPTREKRTFTVATTVRDPDGTVVATLAKSETITTWIELFLIFGMSGAHPRTVIATTLSDLAQSTIVGLHERGVW